VGIVPLVLVLSAAGAHAGWNLIAKRAGGGAAFVWLCAVADFALYAPAAIVQLLIRSGDLSWAGAGFMVGSGVLHIGYFSALQEGYAEGDLSLVYPLARGTGPLLSVIAAVAILGQRASAAALAGAALIVAAILSLTRGARGAGAGRAIALAVLTGAFIAAYTIWDAHAVSALHQPVMVYFCGAEATRSLLLMPLAIRRRAEVARVWQSRKWSVFGVGLLAPAAYILVLTALTLASVVFVAPAREISIVFGIVLGANVLGEGGMLRRTIAGVAILAGVVLLSIG
jgi:drug/metabolite transporter (DMT)-like permease